MFINNELSYIYDDPAKYKDLTFYPVTVEHAMEFQYYIDCLLIDKNSIPDIKVISMTYFEYLISASNEENFYYSKFISLMNLCLKLKGIEQISEEQAKINYDSGKNIIISDTNPVKKDNVIVVNNEKNISWDKTVKLIKRSMNKDIFYFDEPETVQVARKDGVLGFYIKSMFYTSSDFDNIRNIILEQNDVEKIDEKTRKSVRDKLEERQKIANQINGVEKFCDFENQLVYVSIVLCCSLEEVKKMTIRKFRMYIARINHKTQYEVITPAYMAAGVDGKKHKYPTHPMADLTNDNKYSNILIEEEVVEKKTGSKIQRQKTK